MDPLREPFADLAFEKAMPSGNFSERSCGDAPLDLRARLSLQTLLSPSISLQSDLVCVNDLGGSQSVASSCGEILRVLLYLFHQIRRADENLCHPSIMSPIRSIALELQPRANSSHFSESAHEVRQQWTQPTDVFSVLLLLGGEIVNKALAQLAGGVLTPVAFSFGVTRQTHNGTAFFLVALLIRSPRLGLIRSNNIPSERRRRKTDAIRIRRPVLADNREKRLYSQQHQLGHWPHAPGL